MGAISSVTSRRELILALGATVIEPASAFAQAANRYRLGVLTPSAASFKEAHWVAFFRHLGELGLVEGRNLSIERRHAGGQVDRLPALATELANLKCDVFVTGGAPAALAALSGASKATPIIVMAVDFDPVASGDVASLARPGGHVTGITAMQSAMPAKRLELLKEMLPGIGKVAVFSNSQTTEQLSVVQGAAQRTGLALHIVDFKDPPFDYKAGFASAERAKADALFVLGSALWVPARSTIVELALKARLPSVFHHLGWVEAGGLMSYGFNFSTIWRRGAEMAAAVLRGTKVSEIPMEQPNVFQLALNLKTAKVLGIAISRSVLLRADRVIE